MSNNKKNASNTKEQHNALPKTVFIPFKISRTISTIFMALSMLATIYILFKVLNGAYIFSQEELKDFADFTLNIIFVIAALGFTIFSLPISKTHPKKDKIMFSYIGQTCWMASIAIFTYIISYCSFLSDIILGLYFCIMFMILCGCVTTLLTVIIAYFDIKD